MAVLPQQQFTLDNVPMRTGPHGERPVYDSKSLNRKFAGSPKGVYFGFEPVAVGSVLQLQVDATHGVSLLKSPSVSDPGGMDVTAESTISLDFAASSPGEFLPDGIQVIAIARYLENAETTAEIITRSKTLTSTEGAIGAAPAVFDLANIPHERISPGSVSIGVSVDGFGPDTITDDGNGVVTSTGPALSSPGTVDYYTGEFVGVTLPLAALSSITYTRTRGIARDEVQLCRVTGTPGAIVVVGSPPTWGAPADRDVPLAAGAADLDYGFMPPGSMEALAAVVEILNEVAAARVDLQSVTHPDIKTRLDVDLAAPAMGARLGKVIKLIRSNAREALAGDSQVNISGSMSEINRDYEPKLTFTGDGSEAKVGAVAAPIDAVRNMAIVVDALSGERLVSDEVSRLTVIGRVEQVDDAVLDGVISFSNALTAVTGDSDTAFLTQIDAGDTIQGPDGGFYEVTAISSNSSLLLKDAYQSASASSANLLRRRFLLNFSTLAAGVETTHELATGTTIEVFFPVFVSHAQANFHNSLALHRSGERSPVPDATTVIPGKVELAGAVSPLAGAVNLQERGVDVLGGPFHTLNFTATEAAITALADGISEVVGIGPQGAQGIGGGLGPQGPDGDQGPSYDSINEFQILPEQFLGPGPGQADVDLTWDFGFDIGFLSGGIARVRDDGTFAPQDWFELTNIFLDSAQVGRIQGFGSSGLLIDIHVGLYLNAAGFST